MYEHITLDVRGGIATLRLQRPDVYNAFHREMILELNDALRACGEAEDVAVVILTGEGDGFCTGADVSRMPDWSDAGKAEYGAFLWLVQSVIRQIRTMSPVCIAAVNGPAVGAGCDIALACDLRVLADDDAYFREGFVRVGLIPGDGGAWLLSRLIGESKAKEYLLTGRDIGPEAAVDLGLVVETTDDVLAAATDLADELLGNPITAVQGTKHLTNTRQSFDEYCEAAIDIQWECVTDPEHQETVSAFQEGRAPEFDRDF